MEEKKDVLCIGTLALVKLRQILIASILQTKTSQINYNSHNLLQICMKIAKLLKKSPVLTESIERFRIIREETGLVTIFEILLLMMVPFIRGPLNE